MARVLDLGPCVRSVRPFALVVNYHVSKQRSRNVGNGKVGKRRPATAQLKGQIRDSRLR